MRTPREREAGVSLVEVMVVLAIVGVLTGAAALGLGRLGGGARAESEARRLAARIQLAADDALATGVPRALAWNERGYRFLVWNGDEQVWEADRRALIAEPHSLPGGLSLERADGDGPLVLAPDLARPAALLRVGGADESWQVAFDGLSAMAAPAGS